MRPLTEPQYKGSKTAMSASKLQTTSFALFLTAVVALPASAQLDSSHSPFYGSDNDMQWFEPVDLDIDGRGSSQQSGFFLSYDKTYWSVSGERVEVGDPNTVQQGFRVYSAIPLDPISGQPITPPLLTNSIQNAVPRAAFHFGDRYDFGHWKEDGTGWLFSVLNGSDLTQTFNIGLNGGAQEGQGGLASPLGDVFVSFRTNPGALAGFLDLDDGELNGILQDDSDGDGILDGDGIADDINDNGQHGADGFDTDDPGNQPDTIVIGATPDFGDLVTLVTAFREANIRNQTKINGFEMMRAYRLKNSHFKVANQNNHFEVHYGARFLQFDDQFFFSGNGGLSLGDSQWDTTIVNNIVGPQVGYRWQHSQGRWTFDSVGKLMLGYNIRNWQQVGFIGEDLTPSRPNHPLFLRAKSFSYGRNDGGFSPVSELRLNVNYRVTDNIRLKLGWTGTFADNIRRAASSVDYTLFENGNVLGFRDDGTQELFAHGLNIGFEVTQ